MLQSNIEFIRETHCRDRTKNHCTPGQTCYVDPPCPGHYVVTCSSKYTQCHNFLFFGLNYFIILVMLILRHFLLRTNHFLPCLCSYCRYISTFYKWGRQLYIVYGTNCTLVCLYTFHSFFLQKNIIIKFTTTVL